MPYYINERSKNSKKFTIEINDNKAIISSKLDDSFVVTYDIEKEQIVFKNKADEKHFNNKVLLRAQEFAKKNIIKK